MTTILRWLDPAFWIGRVSEIRYWAYLMLIPAFALVSVVIFYPITHGIWLSFHELLLLRTQLGRPFVGLKHFIELMADHVFWMSVRNTAVFAIFNVLFPFLLGLVSALALKRAKQLSGFIRTLY